MDRLIYQVGTSVTNLGLREDINISLRWALGNPGSTFTELLSTEVLSLVRMGYRPKYHAVYIGFDR